MMLHVVLIAIAVVLQIGPQQFPLAQLLSWRLSLHLLVVAVATIITAVTLVITIIIEAEVALIHLIHIAIAMVAIIAAAIAAVAAAVAAFFINTFLHERVLRGYFLSASKNPFMYQFSPHDY